MSNLIIKQTEPFNAETPLEVLRQSSLTQQADLFVRNHGNIPQIDPQTYRLKIEGLVNQPLEISLAELKNNFEFVEVEAALQCAGNRRTVLSELAPTPGEVAWENGAIGNCLWGGVRLKDVLAKVGIPEAAQHVAFESADIVEKHGEKFGFGASISLAKALSDEVLLVWQLNGQDLTPLHGAPLRIIVAGYIGARSVKWLSRIMVQTEPSTNYFQAQTYKLFEPNINVKTANPAQGQTIENLRLNSVICQPLEGEKLVAGKLKLNGYAVAGDKPLKHIELSLDAGMTWQTADLLNSQSAWGWRLWQTEFDLKTGQYEVIVRAWDTQGHTQPADPHTVWNFKGYMNNAYHKIKFEVI